MDFWRWLTSAEGVPVLVGIIGVLGTISAVAATIITQLVVEDRVKARESARFDYEKQRDKDAADAAEKARFESVKREAFIRWVMAMLTLQDFVEGYEETSFVRTVVLARRRLREMLAAKEEFTRPLWRSVS